MREVQLDRNQYLELEKLALGAFHPLTGFMNEIDFNAVVSSMRLYDGTPFPIPVVLGVFKRDADRLKGASEISLLFEDEEVGRLFLNSVYSPDKRKAVKKIYGTDDLSHPGVAHFLSMGEVFLGGPVKLTKRKVPQFPEFEMTPQETRAEFAKRGLKTVVGFQTRNVPHRAHEYLQRIALEHVDGLFIQPLIGLKKNGDYTAEAIIKGYQTLIHLFYPESRVLFGTLSTAMRYAGPREAVFHAIIRRNYGCTHFIVGRDHAGVGSFYGKYDAHRLIESFEGELGIKIMCLHGPYYCARCDGIVTEQTCPHESSTFGDVTQISGTDIRAMLVGGKKPDKNLMRPEVIQSLNETPLFISE